MTARYTRGIWHLSQEHTPACSMSIRDADDRLIAFVADRGVFAETVGNAALLSTAPFVEKSAEGLVRILDKLEAHHRGVDRMLQPEVAARMAAELLDVLRRALRIARGEP